MNTPNDRFFQSRTAELLDTAAAIAQKEGKPPMRTLENRAVAVLLFKAELYRIIPELPRNEHPQAKHLNGIFGLMLATLDPELFVENRELFLKIQRNFLSDLLEQRK